MEKIHILINDNNLEIALYNIIEILGFLPVIVQQEQNKFVRNCSIKLLFTDYYHLKSKNTTLDNFERLVIITPISEDFLHIDSITKKFTYFSGSPTIKNIKNLLQNLR